MPIYYVYTEHNTLFLAINHVRDVGHFLVLGVPRAGRSTFSMDTWR